MREQGGLAPSNGVQPPPRPGWPAAQSFELLHGPSHEMLVDARCQGVQHGAVEGPVVVDPASHLGVDSLGDAGQVRAAATVEVPGPDLPAFRFLAVVLMAGAKLTKNPRLPRTSRPRKV